MTTPDPFMFANLDPSKDAMSHGAETFARATQAYYMALDEQIPFELRAQMTLQYQDLIWRSMSERMMHPEPEHDDVSYVVECATCHSSVLDEEQNARTQFWQYEHTERTQHREYTAGFVTTPAT